MNDAFEMGEAADAFDPLGPGGYIGEIELGAFVEHIIRNGHRHGSLGLRLNTGQGKQRIVRCSFLLASPTALEAARRDTETLLKWARLVGAAPARDWLGVVNNLWLGQRRLNVDLEFHIRRADRSCGYVLLDTQVIV